MLLHLHLIGIESGHGEEWRLPLIKILAEDMTPLVHIGT